MLTCVSMVDLRLAFRLLIKHRGLTLVGGLGIAVAVTIGASFFSMTGAVFRSTLPFEAGDRVVAIEVVDTEAWSEERRVLHDFEHWREELRTIRELGAWRPVRHNLTVPGGPVQPVDGAEMTASGFRLTGVSPALGRTPAEEDERAGSPPVVVIGHDLWQARFGGDPEVVGREVRLGSAPHTVIGVMPKGFAFPVNHALWTPLRVAAGEMGPREGPGVHVFGRLAPGATLEGARAELETVGRRMAAAFPGTHERLRPRVLPYTLEFFGNPARAAFQAMQLVVMLLLVVVCINVAVLVYARTVSRLGEIAVRSALGASRRRVVAQLFVEALVLSLGAAGVGLIAAEMILAWFDRFTQETGALPFWIDLGVSTGTVLYAVGLAVLAAVIIGVLPALKATGRGLQDGLRDIGGATGTHLGGKWTALIVAQVAIAVAILPAASHNAWEHLRYGFDPPDFAADEFLTANLTLDREPLRGTASAAPESGPALHPGDRLGELIRRLEADPAVAEVTFASYTIGDELPATVETDGATAATGTQTGHRVRFNHVGSGFFEAFEASILSGRGFRPADAGDRGTAVVVNRAFVEKVFGDGAGVGHQIRYIDRHSRASGLPFGVGGGEGGWYEVVGVVDDGLVAGVEPGESELRVYHAATPAQVDPAALAVRVRGGSPADFAPRLREVAADVNPMLHLGNVLPLDEALRQMHRLLRGIALAIGAVTSSVLLLSAAGIHALMSFAVARRRKEIGIRAALGAGPRRLLVGIFARAFTQLAIGVVLGMGAAVLVERYVENLTRGNGITVLPLAALLMLLVGLLATAGPARRGLRIEPTEALKAD